MNIISMMIIYSQIMNIQRSKKKTDWMRPIY